MIPIFLYLAMAAASAAAGVVSAQQSAKAQEQAGKVQADTAEMAARNQELQAAEAIRRERVNKRRRLARMRADRGASGVVMTGSSLDVFAETAGIMEISLQDAARESSMAASNTRSQGQTSLWESRVQAGATRLQSYGSLLSQASSTATGTTNFLS